MQFEKMIDIGILIIVLFLSDGHPNIKDFELMSDIIYRT